jgi:hypothetical protein
LAFANIKLQGRLNISSAHNAVDKPAACNHKRPIILWVNCCCRSFGAREEIALGGDSIHIVLLLLIASMCMVCKKRAGWQLGRSEREREIDFQPASSPGSQVAWLMARASLNCRFARQLFFFLRPQSVKNLSIARAR